MTKRYSGDDWEKPAACIVDWRDKIASIIGGGLSGGKSSKRDTYNGKEGPNHARL